MSTPVASGDGACGSTPVKARKLLFKVHLYTAFAGGLLLSLMGLSGSILVFRNEIDRLLEPHLLRVEPVDERVSVESVLTAVRWACLGDSVRYIFPPQTEADTYQVQTTRAGRRLYVDPHNGAVLGSRLPRETFTGLLYALHSELLGGEVGKRVVGVGGILLLLLGVTGLLLWWPGRGRWRRGFQVQWRSNWKRVIFDLHRVGGFLSLPVLILSAVTGASLVFSGFVTGTVLAFSGTPELPPVTVPVVQSSGQPLSLDDILRRADAALPGATVTRISLPASAGATVVVRKRLPSESHPNGMSFIHVDPHTGEVLSLQDATRAGVGERVLNGRYPLHIGASGGLPMRILTAVGGIAPAALFITGCIVWWNRTGATRRTRASHAERRSRRLAGVAAAFDPSGRR